MTTLTAPLAVLERIAAEPIPTEQVERMTGGAPGERHLSFLGMALHLMGIPVDDAHVVLGVTHPAVQRWCSPALARPVPADMLTVLEPLRISMNVDMFDMFGRCHSHTSTAIVALRTLGGSPNCSNETKAVEVLDDRFSPLYEMDEIDQLRAESTRHCLRSLKDPDGLDCRLPDINWLAPPTPFAALVRLAGMTRRDVAEAISEHNDTQCSVGDVRAMMRGKVAPCESDMRAMLAIAFPLFRDAHLILSYEDDVAPQEAALGWFLGLRTPAQCGRWVA